MNETLWLVWSIDISLAVLTALSLSSPNEIYLDKKKLFLKLMNRIAYKAFLELEEPLQIPEGKVHHPGL